MSIGLPGIGLSGLFMLLTALLMPLAETVRTIRGQGSASRWRQVGRQWSMAACMVIIYAGAIWLVSRLVTSSRPPRGVTASLIPQRLGAVGVLVISLGILTALLGMLALSAHMFAPPQFPSDKERTPTK
jgi:protein-S-isoprenylcysteine O-methyltransferase Ste14